MEEHREVLQGLREIRQRFRKETPQYTDNFDDYVLSEVFRDWDVISEPVFTDAEILQLETSLQRARLRFTERTNALKVRLLEQLLDQYVDVIQKAETRHRQLLRDYERDLREPPGSATSRSVDPMSDEEENIEPPREDRENKGNERNNASKNNNKPNNSRNAGNNNNSNNSRNAGNNNNSNNSRNAGNNNNSNNSRNAK